MEIIVFIVIALIFYIVVLPFINNFGGNSKHKDSGKITKTKEAFKGVGNNYRETKEAISKGFSALEKGLDALEKETRAWPEKAERFRLEEQEKGYQRGKQKVEEVNVTYRKLGLPEVSLVDFFAYNKDYQERARKELAELETKKRAERLLVLIEESHKNEIVPKNEKLEATTDTQFSQKENLEIFNCKQHDTIGLVENNELHVIEGLNRPIDIQLNQLPIELIEFIYIRYYLTGEKSLPKHKCINDSWAKSHYADSELNDVQWGKIIEKMSFDETKCKKIDALYHFTHKDNLSSILSKGLLTKQNLEEQGLKYKYNDEHRWDGIEDSISLSVSHPNWKMFFKYRSKLGKNDWVVLKVSPKLLSGVENLVSDVFEKFNYLDKAIFNKFNAASFNVQKLSIAERKSHQAFLDMFESNIGKTLETYTFDNQAEILYQGNIPTGFIEAIYIVEEDQNLSWVHDLGFKLSVNKTVFEKR